MLIAPPDLTALARLARQEAALCDTAAQVLSAVYAYDAGGGIKNELQR